MFFFKRKRKNRLSLHTVFIAKENILFLKEWLLYHKAIGFDKFYLYDNSEVKYGDDNESEKSNIKLFKAGKVSKYGVHYDTLINLSNDQTKNLLCDIIDSFNGDVKLIKWSPRNDEGKVRYAHVESLNHFKKHYGSKNDWVAFIDMDEYVISPSGIVVREYLEECDKKKIRMIRIFQKKFQCRYSNLDKNVIDIHNCIDDIDTTFNHYKGSWGEKLFVKMDYLKNIINIHNMSVGNKKEINMELNDLRFNHYNVTDEMFPWMKKWFDKDSLKYSKDSSMLTYKNKIDLNESYCSVKWRKSLLNLH